MIGQWSSHVPYVFMSSILGVCDSFSLKIIFIQFCIIMYRNSIYYLGRVDVINYIIVIEGLDTKIISLIN